MKQLEVRENGILVYNQALSSDIDNEHSCTTFKTTFYSLKESKEDYFEYLEYFEDLLKVINSVPCASEDINLILNVNGKFTLLTLYLTEEQIPCTEEIKVVLLKAFPDDIEQISIKGNEMNIFDFFYELN